MAQRPPPAQPDHPPRARRARDDRRRRPRVRHVRLRACSTARPTRPGYPEYNAVVGGVASHWDEATGDMIVRGVVGWGGRGVRGDTDRIASRILGGLLTNILANQFAMGLTAVERPGARRRSRRPRVRPLRVRVGPRAGVLLPQVRDAAAPRLTRAEHPDADLRVPLHRVRPSRRHPPRDQRSRAAVLPVVRRARGRCASSSRRRRSTSRARAGRRRTAARSSTRAPQRGVVQVGRVRRGIGATAASDGESSDAARRPRLIGRRPRTRSSSARGSSQSSGERVLRRRRQSGRRPRRRDGD